MATGCSTLLGRITPHKVRNRTAARAQARPLVRTQTASRGKAKQTKQANKPNKQTSKRISNGAGLPSVLLGFYGELRAVREGEGSQSALSKPLQVGHEPLDGLHPVTGPDEPPCGFGRALLRKLRLGWGGLPRLGRISSPRKGATKKWVLTGGAWGNPRKK